jgi:hypothetical protein
VRRHLPRVGGLLLAATALSTTVQAHEPGLIRVDVDVAASGNVRVHVPIDPVVVWRAIELDAGRVPTAAPSMDVLHHDRARLERAVRDGVALRAGAVLVTLAVVGSDWHDAGGMTAARIGAPVLVTLDGQLPAGTRTITWQYDAPATAYPLRVLQPGRDEPRVTWVTPGRPSEALLIEPPALARVVRLYVWLGVIHIVPRGLDHILFVLSLCLLSPRWRPLLAQVSAFTAAHTLTLAASALGWISWPGRWVEPLIAASIAWVAIKNLRASTLSRTRLAVVFAFGLLHGAGFAGVLGELGLPVGARLLALLSFNAGVEIGQLLVITVALAGMHAVLRWPGRYRGGVVVPASIAIALVGAYWAVERVVAAALG